MKELFVVDATGFLFRSYYAIRGMSNTEGRSTGALFGFVRSLLKLIKDFEPTHLCAVFDAPDNKSSRVALYKDYKAQRWAMPEDLPHQLEAAKEFCSLIGIPTLIMPGVESDDTMGSIASWAKDLGSTVFLCTSDKDLFQLVDERVRVLQTHKNNLIMGPEEVVTKLGVSPDQVVDYLAMVGDSSDNVPGLPGFGPKTAAQLLEAFGGLDYILDHPDEIPGKKKQETVRTYRDQAELSRRLVQLDLSVAVSHSPRDYQRNGSDFDRLRSFYKTYGFRSLLDEMQSADEGQKGTESSEAYRLIQSEDDFEHLIQVLNAAKEICFDTETTSLQALDAELVGIGFAVSAGESYYLPFNSTLNSDLLWSKLTALFTNPSIAFYAHNAKYDLHILANYGIRVATLCFDTLLASYLLSAEDRQHSLDFLAKRYFDKTKTPIESLIGKGKKEISMADVPFQAICDYCCEDVDYTLRLKAELSQEIEDRGLSRLLYELELPLASVLLEMERRGIFVDAEMLRAFSLEITEALESLEAEIYELAGEEFNIKSPKQLSQILFEKMGISPPKKTATGYSTNAEVLEKLKLEHPIAGKILEFRALEKLRSTYADTLPKQINSHTGRIHCTFNQGVTATGRLSSQHPNLQNIPVRTALGRKIREAFRPQKADWSYLSADYSQIELRLMAHMSEDPDLIQAFHNGEDIHAFTASQVFAVPLEKVSKEQRYQAKAVNFGIIYGQQAYGLSQELGITPAEARAFIEAYFSRYPKVRFFIERCKEESRRVGKARTLIGRERGIADIQSKNVPLRLAAERLAVNTPLQGSAADIIKMAMLRVDRVLQEEDLESFLVLQIHDELIFEVPDGEIPRMKTVVRSAMEGVLNLRVPLVVDISVGKNWKEC